MIKTNRENRCFLPFLQVNKTFRDDEEEGEACGDKSMLYATTIEDPADKTAVSFRSVAGEEEAEEEGEGSANANNSSSAGIALGEVKATENS